MLVASTREFLEAPGEVLDWRPFVSSELRYETLQGLVQKLSEAVTRLQELHLCSGRVACSLSTTTPIYDFLVLRYPLTTSFHLFTILLDCLNQPLLKPPTNKNSAKHPPGTAFSFSSSSDTFLSRRVVAVVPNCLAPSQPQCRLLPSLQLPSLQLPKALHLLLLQSGTTRLQSQQQANPRSSLPSRKPCSKLLPIQSSSLQNCTSLAWLRLRTSQMSKS